MTPRRWVYAVTDPLRRRLEARFQALDTARFLHDRHARLIIQEKQTNNFYAVRAYPVTDISAEQEQLRLHMKLLAKQRLQVAVINKATQRPVTEVIVPISDAPDIIDLHLDGTVLKLELDPAPPPDVPL